MPALINHHHRQLIHVGLDRATGSSWGASVSAGAVFLAPTVAPFQRKQQQQLLHWNLVSPTVVRKLDLDVFRVFSSLFLSDLIAYPPGAMADKALGKPDKWRDAMFYASDKFLALLDFLLGLVYEVLDFCNSGWCDQSGLPLPDQSRPSRSPGTLSAGSRLVAVEKGDPCSHAMKEDLANFFYRPRTRRVRVQWEITRDGGAQPPSNNNTSSEAVSVVRTTGGRLDARCKGPLVRRGAKCTCWGWHLDELLAISQGNEDNDAGSVQGRPVRHHASTVVGPLVKQIVLAEHRKSGWSECRCDECVSMLMPLEQALGRLYVPTAEAGATTATSSGSSSGSSISFGPSSVRYLEEGPGREDSEDEGRDMAFSTDDSSDSSSDSECGTGIRSEFNMYSLPFELIGLVGGLDTDQAEAATRMVVNNTSLTFRRLDSRAAARPTSAVIFLHGIYSSSTFWFETVIPHLSDDITSRHQILVPDLLGCGKSPRPVDSLYTLEEQVESIHKSVLERHNVDSFHIVSHSMGTVVALALAARFPDRVRSLTLIAPLYGGTGEADGVDPQLPTCDTIMALTKPWTLKGMKAIAGKDYYNVSRLIAHVLFTRHQFWVPLMHRHLKRYPISFIEGYFRNSHHATWHMSHNTLLSGTHSMAASLAKLRQKGKQVLVIHGDVDTTCFYRQSVEMSRHFSNVRLVTASGKGHVDVIFENESHILQHVESEIAHGDAQWARNVRGRTCSMQDNEFRRSPKKP